MVNFIRTHNPIIEVYLFVCKKDFHYGVLNQYN